MENEYQVLSHLQENEKTSQRAIAEQTGLSLGAVNILIKKMARKGLIKVEHLNSRTMRYILTPQGMQEKARLTYSYIRQSYRQLLTINQTIDKLVDDYQDQLDGSPIIIFGPEDEMREIIAQHLQDLGLSFQTLSGLTELSQYKTDKTKNLVITWREDEEGALPSNNSAVNIMKML